MPLVARKSVHLKGLHLSTPAPQKTRHCHIWRAAVKMRCRRKHKHKIIFGWQDKHASRRPKWYTDGSTCQRKCTEPRQQPRCGGDSDVANPKERGERAVEISTASQRTPKEMPKRLALLNCNIINPTTFPPKHRMSSQVSSSQRCANTLGGAASWIRHFSLICRTKRKFEKHLLLLCSYRTTIAPSSSQTCTRVNPFS